MSRFMSALVASAVAAAVLPASAQAATLVVDVAGIETGALLGDASNTVLRYNLGTGAIVTGIAWDMTITAFSPSWLSEVTIAFTDATGGAGVYFTPGVGQSNAGTSSFSGSTDLVSQGLSFRLSSDVLRIEFAETYDDVGISPDAIFNSGTVTLTYTPGVAPIPEPASWALMIVGFGLTGGMLRRHRKQTVKARFA